MRFEDALRLERTPYPGAAIRAAGESLRVLTRDEVAFVPPVDPPGAVVRCPIVVPTSREVRRNRKNIARILELAAGDASNLVLFLCSGAARADDIARVARAAGRANWVAVDGPFPSDAPDDPPETSRHVAALRTTRDTAEKRNFALRLARQLNWSAVFFHDDDVVVTRGHLRKASALLRADDVSVVGFSARSFPDNSVAVHASRMVSGQVDTFIGAGALAVRVDSPVTALFPRAYNEDWLFLLVHCFFAERSVVWAGTVEQRAYDPFADVRRAVDEEVGDLLGEGLIRLAMATGSEVQPRQDLKAVVKALGELADEPFWEREITARLAFLRDTHDRISRRRPRGRRARQAMRALEAAQRRLLGTTTQPGVRAADLAGWVRAWTRDLERWNAPPGGPAPVETDLDLAERLDLAGYAGRYAYDCARELLRPAPPGGAAGAVSGTPAPEEYIDPGDTAYRPVAARGVENTRRLQRFMTSQRLDLRDLVRSADSVRFDRPVARLNESMPVLTVGMLVACGESPELVLSAVSTIIADAGATVAVQLVVWVLGEPKVLRHAGQAYRDRLAVRLVAAVAGTNVRLRTSLLDDSRGAVDEVIAVAMRDLALAYWKANIPAGHPVVVVNSRLDLVRSGSFGEFMHTEHTVPSQSLAGYLRRLPAVAPVASPITQADDRDALIEARQRLASGTRRPARAWSWRADSTAGLVRRMRRAGLSWVELDEVAYDLVFHDLRDEQVLPASVGVGCVAVRYRDTAGGDLGAAVRAAARVAAAESTRGRGTMVSFQADEAIAHHQLDAYRRVFMAALADESSRAGLPLMSFADRRREHSRARALAVAHYTYWLYNHQRVPTLRWRELPR